MSTHVRAATLSNFAEVAREGGLNPTTALREAGIDPAVLRDQDTLIPANRVFDLLEGAARATGLSNFGLRMAEARRLADFGVVSLLIAHASTLREGLQTTIRYLNMINEALAIDMEEAGDLVVIREALVGDGQRPRRQAYELAVGAMFGMCGALLGPNWRPQMVCFTHATPDDLTVHRRFLGPSVRFNCDFNGVVCLAADLDRANPAADPKLAGYARRFLDSLDSRDRASTARQVRKALHQLMPLGRATIGQTARALGLHVRTLQRRLAGEGEEFSAILAGVRRDMALNYLESSNISLTQIAVILGYGRLSSFSRWFASEFDRTAGDWRQERAIADPAITARAAVKSSPKNGGGAAMT